MKIIVAALLFILSSFSVPLAGGLITCNHSSSMTVCSVNLGDSYYSPENVPIGVSWEQHIAEMKMINRKTKYASCPPKPDNTCMIIEGACWCSKISWDWMKDGVYFNEEGKCLDPMTFPKPKYCQKEIKLKTKEEEFGKEIARFCKKKGQNIREGIINRTPHLLLKEILVEEKSAFNIIMGTEMFCELTDAQKKKQQEDLKEIEKTLSTMKKEEKNEYKREILSPDWKAKMEDLFKAFKK